MTRKFAGGWLKIPMTEEQYDNTFENKPILVDNFETYLIPRIPSEHYLCYMDEEGNEVKIRNVPRHY